MAIGASPSSALEPRADPFALQLERIDRGRLIGGCRLQAGLALLYFGASWCGPCRVFQPRLREAHHRLRSAAPGTEIVYVGDDTSAMAQKGYVLRERMPWLLVAHDDPARTRLLQLRGPALPGMLLVNRQLEISRSSWRPDGSSAPAEMLRDLLRVDRHR